MLMNTLAYMWIVGAVLVFAGTLIAPVVNQKAKERLLGDLREETDVVYLGMNVLFRLMILTVLSIGWPVIALGYVVGTAVGKTTKTLLDKA